MGLKLTQHQTEQKTILLQALSVNHIATLQGLAGTGKTTMIPFVVAELGFSNHQVLYAAFTGTAVLNMEQTQSTTLHGLLYKPIVRYNKVVGFNKKSMKDLAEELNGIKLILIDEFSMVPHDMMEFLCHTARMLGISVLLVGDHGQLPPIGQPNRYVTQFDAVLNKPMRQALDNPIIAIAHKIRRGELIHSDIYGGSVFVGKKSDLDPAWVKTDTQIICGLNNTRLDFNRKVLHGRTTPQKGDKIMFLRNDLDNSGVSNGTQGTILQMDKGSWGRYEFVVQDERNNIVTVPSLWNEEPSASDSKRGYKTYATHAYAITCHKAQGKTIHDAGLIWDESSMFAEHKDKWLYTALTRFSGKKNLAWLR